MTEDAELLRRYAEEKSEAAFAELVQRHVNFVYACALRRVGGDAHLAEDVTQQVFTALARDAAKLATREVLSGWLFTTTRNASAQVVRSERRRQTRETEAQIMNELTAASAHDAEWERLRPVLDDALDHLTDDDRQAVLLRFFEGKSFADVGAKLRLNENTARMRVERALDKLHGALAQRGVTSTTAALGLALANQAGVAAPAGLAAAVTGAALAGTTATAGWSLVTFMSITKLQIGIVGALAVAGGAGYMLQAETNAGLRREIATVQQSQQTVAALRAENQQLAATVVEVDTLRRDDLELKQLEQRIDEIKQAKVENARLAQAQAQARNQDRKTQMNEMDQRAQQEVDRMNREGNKLVGEYKTLMDRTKDGALTVEERAQADTAAKAKLEEIKAKQKEVQDFISETRRRLSEQFPEFAVVETRTANGITWRRGAPGEIQSTTPPQSMSVPGQIGSWGYVPRAAPGEVQIGSLTLAPADSVSLRLPQADQATAFAAYERLSGVKIIVDPSVAHALGTVDFQTAPVPRAEALQALQAALRDQLNIVLEPTPDGNLVAKRGPR